MTIMSLCLAPNRNAVNTRVSGPWKTGKYKLNAITLRKRPSKGKLGRPFCVKGGKGGRKNIHKISAVDLCSTTKFEKSR